ncbi:MAG TPA: S41 family peptidase [Rubrobacteraceae bacterium]|nr:S41 family peptidase [Rubrobacteraceae bacterium]
MWKYVTKRLNRHRALVRSVLFLLVLLALVLVAYLFERSQVLSTEDREGIALYAEALKVVKEGYINQKAIDPQKQTYGAIKGMLGSLDDKGHTSFLTPDEAEKNRERYSSKQVGIGVRLENDNDKVVVLDTIDGSPAQEAGVKPGDALVTINGESVRGMNIVEVADKLEGSEGSPVKLTALRGGEEHEFSLERVKLTVPAVSWNLIPGTHVAHLRLGSFSEDSSAEFEDAVSEARDNGAERFVLDLRDNSGGWVEQAEKIAARFLPARSVIYVQKDAAGREEEVTVPEDNRPLDVPLVVLVNVGSASSAEILAGSLKDNGRARVVGGKTFGAGTMLEERPLSDGSAIMLATAQWLTPNRDPIQGSGIEPDVKGGLEEGQKPRPPDQLRGLSRKETFAHDAQLKRAFEVLQQG